MAAKKKAPAKRKAAKRKTTAKAPAKVGRPEKYTKEYADALAPRVPALFKNGESLAEVCMELDCCKDSFYKMCELSEEFSVAYKKGLEFSEAWWLKLGRAGSAGMKKINAATWIFNMKNRHGWTDKNQTHIDTGDEARQQMEQMMDNIADILPD